MPNKGIQLPTIIKDITLMSPGVWNEWDYPELELKKAFELTDWDNHETTNLFLDHPENSNNAAGAWAGRVINPRQLLDGTVKGDLEIWDESTIIKMTLAKAKFGVSPRVIGKENEETKTFTDFVFDNFSIVSKPAQSTAIIDLNSKKYIEGFVVKHLNKDDLIKGADIDEIRKKVISLTKRFNIEASELYGHSPLEKKKKKLKGGKKEMSDEEKEKTEEVNSEEASEENKAKESKGEESASEDGNKELSDSDVLSIMNDNFEDFNLYAKGIKAENPSISLKELAKGFSDHKNKLSIVEDLSASEATIMLKKLLNKVGVGEFSESLANKKIAEPSLTKELSAQIQSLTKQVKELSNKKSPAAKAIRGPSLNDSQNVEKVLFGREVSEGVRDMSAFLKQYAR